VRTRDDHGVVALFDPRVQRRSYGRRFLDALPPARRVYAREELVRWWAETRAGRASTPPIGLDGDAGPDVPAPR
jgi:hypothetical protein